LLSEAVRGLEVNGGWLVEPSCRRRKIPEERDRETTKENEEPK
jgi:hypothetical protein